VDEPQSEPYRLHIVHAGSHSDYAQAAAVITRQERKERDTPAIRICVRHAKSTDELARELTEPAAAIVFTGHGSTDGTWFGGDDAYIGPEEIKCKAGRPITANGLILDACFAWSYREEITRQSAHELAYLAPDGRAPYSHTWLVTAVLLALLAPGNTSLGTADTVQQGMIRGVEAAKVGWPQGKHDRWRCCILSGTPATS
jgi:hypothetical protein